MYCTKKYNHALVSFFSLLLCVLSLLSCTIRENANTVTVAIGGNPNSLDPHRTSATITKEITRNIYDTLVESDFSPLLAETWSVSQDKRTWSFTLRNDVFFHHGKQLTAQDVIASIHRIQDPQINSPMKDNFSIIKSAFTKGDYTVLMTLTQASTDILPLFADPQSAILPQDLIEEGHNFNRTPVGTGPFVFSHWEDNTSITLNKNENYLYPIALESIVFIVLADPTAAMQAMAQKVLDVAPKYISESELSQIRAMKHMKVVEKSGATLLVLAMNMRNDLLSSKGFRKAVARAIDTETVLKDAYKGGEYTPIFWPNKTPYSVSKKEFTVLNGTPPIEYAPDEAKQYFAAHFERIPQGKPLVITVPQAYAHHVRAAQLYQNMLKAVGLKTTIELVDWPTWMSRVYTKGIFDFTVIGHTGKLTPDQRLRGYGEAKSYVGWNDEAFVALLASARATTNAKKQAKLYKQAFVRMSEAQPFVFVGQSVINVAHHKRVKNIRIDPVLELYDFRHAVIK